MLEKRLPEGGDRFREIVENAPVGIIQLDAEGRLQAANAALVKLLGYPLDELAGRSVLEVTHPEDRAMCGSWFGKALEEGEAHVHELRCRRKDGVVIWLQLSGRAARDGRGRAESIVATVEDLTQRVRAQRLARHLAAIVEHSDDAIVSETLDGIVLSWNTGAEDLYGYAPEEVVGKSVSVLVPEHRTHELQAVLKRVRRGSHVSPFETQRRRKDGSLVDVSLTVSPIKDESGKVTSVSVIARDISQRKDFEARLERHALYDALTDLPNRALFMDRLEHALQYAKRRASPLAVLLLDLDLLKDVNDTFGHRYGDLLVKEVGRRLAAVLRESDTIGRLGGDEFAIILPGATVDNARRIASKVESALNTPFSLEGQNIYASGSIGIAVYPKHGADPGTLLRHADMAMYAAKRTGAGHDVFREEQDEFVARRLLLVADLRHAIEDRGIKLHYQPKVDVRTGQVTGLEALARWLHPERGFVPPLEFVTLAEHTGLIGLLTSALLDVAFEQARDWERQGRSIKVCLNLSARVLHDDNLARTLERLALHRSVSPGWLGVEITETAIMSDPASVMKLLQQLREMGVTVSIDDFGTGYSSLAYLSELPVGEVKVDRAFIKDLVTNPQHQNITRAVIGLGHDLGLSVVAEGVEDHESVRLLSEMGCDQMQGYALSRPLPAEEITMWLDAAQREPLSA